MNRVLYVGQYSEGTTSKMRCDNLKNILAPQFFDVINTNIPFLNLNQFWKSIGFRFKKGKAIKEINKFVISNINLDYDLIWVDKAVFLTSKTTNLLKSKTNLLIHYTPDTAFFHNKSKLFFNSLSYYDFIITTKSFDLPYYNRYIDKSKIIILNQGFDNTVHYSRVKFDSKENYILFIGLYEPARAEIINNLLNNGIQVCLAGMKWRSFVRKNKVKGLTFLGDSIFKDEYAFEISKAKMALGLVSKRFPELHTTRTFEIPACGTALITERNSETTSFFNEDEVIFFNDENELVKKINYYFKNSPQLKVLTEKGMKKVNDFDYEIQLKQALNIIIKS